MSSYITTPAFEDTLLPPPPILQSGKEAEFLRDMEKYLQQLHVVFNDLQVSINAGWLIKNPRVISIDADKITANTTFTQDLFAGINKNIQILGTSDVIQIKDKQSPPKTRVKLGKLGTANDDWGIEVTDNTGTVRFRAGNTTYINGAIIVDATITTTKLANNSVTNDKVASGLSASKVTTGTLTVSSTSVAINVTSGGAVILNAGADIIFRRSASTSDFNWLVFQNSSGTTEAQIGYYPTLLSLVMTAGGGRIRVESDDGSIGLQPSSSGFLNISQAGGTGRVPINGVFWFETSLLPSTDNTYDLGASTRRWRSLYIVNKPCVIETESGMTTLWAIESPEYRFLDWGSVYVNNRQHISLDKKFIECVDESDYLVFLTPEANARCWIENKSDEGFDIVTDTPCRINYMISAYREGWKNLRFFHTDNTYQIPDPKISKQRKKMKKEKLSDVLR
jgi:hypothetical protein